MDVEDQNQGQRGTHDGAVSLADCITLMQADLVHVNPSPSTSGHRVAGVLMYDPLAEMTTVADSIILAVGLSCESPGFLTLLERATRGNAAAVVVKAYGASMGRMRAAVEPFGLAVLVAPDSAEWSRLVTLARAAVGGAGTDSVSGVRLGDLYAFANAAASIANGAVSIVDPLGRVLGYSTLPGQPIDELRRVTTLSLEETTAPAFDKDFKTVYDSATAILIPATDQELGRLALAVRAGDELLGSMWIIDPGAERRGAALAALDRMAALAGLHMLHARAALDFGQRRNADLIRTLLDDTAHASFAAAQLGLDAAKGFAVAAFSIVRPKTGNLESIQEIQKLLHLVTTVCTVQFGSSHSAMIDSVVYALLPCEGNTPRSVHRRVVADIGAYSQTISSYPLIAAVGGIALDVEDLPASRAQALQTLKLLVSRQPVKGGAKSAASLYEDHRVPLNLLQIGAFIDEQDMADADDLAALQAHDNEHQSEYVDTLRAYLESNGNISAMAARLHVHNNTVRYRLTRLAADFGLDLDDPHKRLWLWLRLVTMDLASR
ncbi:Sugar diacid utilization regulator [Arthrobacter alpinus]|uniref:Sugar diacid utilization regulator n=1 Tax=Arthrobacter alpinus TaxID=656366 RepID=A0A1H5DMC0_9MICC|nr:helix-turn-helix domain-containing protein [Arthrobacter alpinus]SED80003.1 Sugar diacid utilization regulator [Arthrobacter alpinus]